jgi:hypothetical protein
LLKVTDQTGAVIAKAKVSLLDSDKKSLYEGMTDPTGQLLIPHLGAGTYSVVIAASNFLDQSARCKSDGRTNAERYGKDGDRRTEYGCYRGIGFPSRG